LTNQFVNPNDEIEDVLVKSLFHRILLLFHIPASWPVWKVVIGLFLLSGLTVLAWFFISGQGIASLAAGLILALFFLIDALVLRSLPLTGTSYGPWQSQLFALALPRTAFSLLISFIAALAGVPWGLGLLIIVQLIGSGALFYGALVEPFRLQLTYLTVETDRFPENVEPIRILHISDLHVERLTRREEMLLELLEEVQADLILITGDYLNLSYVRDKEAHSHVRRLLSQISAPLGVYATLGSPPVDEREIVPELFADLPIHLLVNEWEEIKLADGRGLVLLGIDCSHHLPTDRQRLDQLVKVSPNHFPNVLLYHAPDLMPEAVGYDIDLYLCGHTHGGQVRLPGVGAILTSSQLGKKYEMGLYRDGRTHLYVSRGVGLEGLSAPRVRFLAPPEVTLINIAGPGQKM
jgi:predicted MPP superfamily phosphohydrolase